MLPSCRWIFARHMFVFFYSLGVLGCATAPPRKNPIAVPTIPVAQPPLWGSLRPGAYDVGFRFLIVRDPTRILGTTQMLHPVLAGLWYPSPKSVTPISRLTYADYLHWKLDDPRLATIAVRLEHHGRTTLAEEIVEERWAMLTGPARERMDRVLASPVAAIENALHVQDPMPLLVYHHGAQGTMDESSIMMEYLASYGYVVASIISLSNETVSVTDGASMDEEMRDAEVLIASLQQETWVDSRRLGMIGHSLGAQFSLQFAASHSGVDAVVSMDTTWDYPMHEQRVRAQEGYKRYAERASGFSAAVLGLASKKATFWPFDQAPLAQRYLVNMGELGHDDYLAQKAIAARIPAEKDARPDANAVAYLAKYEQLCEIVRVFLDGYVRDQGEARASLSKMPSTNQTSMGLAFRQLPAGRKSPNVWEIQEWVVKEGPALAIKRCDELYSHVDERCPEEWTSTVARGFLQEDKLDIAVVLLRAHVVRYPKDLLALLSLGGALMVMGDKVGARDAYARVVQQVPATDKKTSELSWPELVALSQKQQAEQAILLLDGKKASP